MIEIADCQLCRLALALEAIEAIQLGGGNTAALDTTTFMVVGDNGSDGDGVSHWPSGRRKGTVYEGGVRVPLVIGGPAVVDGGRMSDALVNTGDLFATALELMGVDPDVDLSGLTLDSESLVPILEDPQVTTVRPRAYMEDFDPACSSAVWERAIRDDQYKLVQKCSAGLGGRCYEAEPDCRNGEEIYAVADVLECCNLANDSTAKSYVDANLRPHLPDDILCTKRSDDLCQGCCIDNESQCPGTPTCHTGTNHECCDDTYTDITVQWDGPGGTPAPNEDYSVYNTIVDGQCLPHIVLKTTNKDDFQVTEYRVGRKDAQGIPLPIGAVTTDWPTALTGSINVRVGATDLVPPLVVDGVATVNVDAQRGDTWSSASVDLAANLAELAEVTPTGQTCSVNDTCSATGQSCQTDTDCPPVGGRFSGNVAGTVKTITAEAIGEGLASGGDLTTDGLAAGADVRLGGHPSTSELRVAGSGTSTATIAIADTAGFLGLVTITDQFNGKLCGANLVTPGNPPAATIPDDMDVAFGPDGQVCDADCANCVTPCPTGITAPVGETGGVEKNRFISFTLPNDGQATPYAIRVLFDSLHHPPAPPGAQNFSAFEGQVRYIHAFLDEEDEPVFECADSGPQNGLYKCAQLACGPEYRDWDHSSVFGTAAVHITGVSVVPSSRYIVQIVHDSPSGYDCRSGGLAVGTSHWGDVNGNGLNVLDIAQVVDKLKELPTAAPEPGLFLNGAIPDPVGRNIEVLDLSRVVDALKDVPYPFGGPEVCP